MTRGDSRWFYAVLVKRNGLAASELVIDLSRLVENFRTVQTLVGAEVTVAAMVKADAYGLGALPICTALAAVGCQHFFVAQLSEGAAVRSAVPDARVYVLNGPMPGTEFELIEHRLEPVINSLDQLELWKAATVGREEQPPAALHVDTGMNRLGLQRTEVANLLADPSVADGVRISHVMSHLASADVTASDQSDEQLAHFHRIRERFPNATASLANSPGTFRGPDYHFDMVRAGVALYGARPSPEGPEMAKVVTLRAPIVQIRTIGVDDPVGYGATYRATETRRLAVVALGYADGFLRSSSGRGTAYLGATPLPVVGRVSMDLITLDVTDVPEQDLWLGAPIELIGEHATLDAVAAAAGTIPHEMLVDLGARMQRRYVTS